MSKKETLTFFSGPGYKLVSVLTLPSDCEEPVPGVVLCHGPGGYGATGLTEKDPLMGRVEDWLAEAGYASLRFYYRGVGDSEGPLYRLIPGEQIEDTQQAISFLQSRKEVIKERIGILGFATGGSYATYVAANDERVKCMVSVSATGDWERWLRFMRSSEEEWQTLMDQSRLASSSKATTGKTETVDLSEIIRSNAETRKEGEEFEKPHRLWDRNLVALESVIPMVAFRPEESASRISPRAAMWIGATGDSLVPNEHQKAMFHKAKEPKRLELVENETHVSLFANDGLKKVMRLATEWVDQHL